MGIILKYKPKNTQISSGRIFDDRYHLLGIIGQGHQSVVYKAERISSVQPHNSNVTESNVTKKPIFAIKVFTRKAQDQENLAAKVTQEASAMLSCKHPNIMQLYDVVTLGDLYYLVMELIDGGSLLSALQQKNGPLPPYVCLMLAIQILDGLCAIHKEGIVHRDIKPANLLVRNDGTVIIADFSIAKLPHRVNNLEDKSIGVGTFDYLAPECLNGNESTHLSDIYATAVTIYQLLTNSLPFQGETLKEQIDNKMQNKFLPLSEHGVDVPKSVEKLIRKGLNVNPNKRFSSAEKFRQAINEILISSSDYRYRKAAAIINTLQNKARTEEKAARLNATQNSNLLPLSSHNTNTRPQDHQGTQLFQRDGGLENWQSLLNDDKEDKEIEIAAQSAIRKKQFGLTIRLLALIAIATISIYSVMSVTLVKDMLFSKIRNTSLLTTTISSPSTILPRELYRMKAFAQGQHLLLLNNFAGHQGVKLYIKRIHNSDAVMLILNLRGAEPHIISADVLSNHFTFEISFDNNEIIFAIDAIDKETSNPISGTFTNKKTHKQERWSVTPSE